MLRFIVGMSLFVCLSSAANAAPHVFSSRIDPELLRQQEQVAASARAFRSAVYDRYRTDRHAFNHYWTAGENTWQAWNRADFPAAHSEAVKSWFDNAATIVGASRFGVLPLPLTLPITEVAPAPIRSVATPQGVFRHAPAQPAGEVVFPTTPSLPRQNTAAPSLPAPPAQATATPQFLTNPTPVDFIDDAQPADATDQQVNPFETDSDDSKDVAESKTTSWLEKWKRAIFTPSTTKPTPQPAAEIPQDLKHSAPSTSLETPEESAVDGSTTD